LVEFALVVPLFIVLVLATVDFGWALRSYITITNSAREGTRIAVTGANVTQIKSRAVNSSSGLLNDSNVTVTGAQGAPGTEVKVKVDYDYDFITPLGSMLSFLTGGTLPNPLPISSETTMRME
jgi:Flp pilus assembly protein TadG